MSTIDTNAIDIHFPSDSILPNPAQVCKVLSDTTQTYSKSDKHLVEWCEGSGVSEAIARLGPRPLKDRKVIAHCIGWKIYPDDCGVFEYLFVDLPLA